MPTPLFDRRTRPDALRFSMVTMTDRWTVRFFHWPQPDGRTPCGQILFQTGRGDFGEKYLESMAHWHRRGWDVSGFDWRGQGGSQPGGGIADFDRMLTDLRSIMGEWIDKGTGPHIVIGHSMGGHLLLRGLAEAMADIDAAVLVAPMLGLNSRPMPRRVAAGIARAAGRLRLRDRPIWHPGADEAGRQARLTADRDRYSDELHWVSQSPEFAVRPPTWGWLAGAYASIAMLDRPGVLEAISVPSLLIGTTQDRLVDAAAIVTAAARMAEGELDMHTTGAHELLREADGVRDAVIARIDGFIDRFVAS